MTGTLEMLDTVRAELGGRPTFAGHVDGRHDLDRAWLDQLYALAVRRQVAHLANLPHLREPA